MSQKNYTLFYSNYCNFCKQFLQKLNKLDIKKEFSFYCVDNNKAPPHVRSTPTLSIRQEQKNLKGKEAFDWLENYIIKKNENAMPSAWHPGEMGSSMSDNYSFLNNENISEGGISHSFSFLNNNNVSSINIDNNMNNDKKKNDELSQKMEYMKQIRDSDTPAPVQRI